jgi:flagella basal body P-ring formation protein FlgA
MNALTKMVSLLLLGCFCGAGADAGTLALLKMQVRLDAGVITVGDLWGNAGAKADTVIGTAPPPGRSIAIETAQLAYIAHLYDVSWRPVSGVERAVVERTGRPLSHDEMEEPLRRSLVEAGAPSTATVELANFVPILVPPSSFPSLAVEAMAYDSASERFSADLVASSEGMQTQRMRVAGKILDMVPALVAAHRLEPGEVLAQADVRVMQVAARRLAGPALSNVSDALGQTPKRTIVSGQPITAGDLGPPLIVLKGATVVMALETSNMSLAAQGLALTSGGRDDVIQVMNPSSRAVIAARVTGPGKAVILPGGAPQTPSSPVAQKIPEVAN